MYYVAFSRPTNPYIILINNIIEVHFWVDMILSFICEYIDPETNLPERSIKKIAKNYVFSWFPIDFVSVFPFELLLPEG